MPGDARAHRDSSLTPLYVGLPPSGVHGPLTLGRGECGHQLQVHISNLIAHASTLVISELHKRRSVLCCHPLGLY